MTDEKQSEISIGRIVDTLKKRYAGEKVLERITIPKETLEQAVQEVYHSDNCKSSWYGISVSAIADLYTATGIIPQYTLEELSEIDEKMTRATSTTAGFGIGHEDAGHIIDYKTIKEVIPLDKLPQYKKTVEEIYETSVGFCSLDLFCLYEATEIKPDFESIAAAKEMKVQDIIDDLYLSAQELSGRYNVDAKLVYAMSGMLPSPKIQESLLKSYLE